MGRPGRLTGAFGVAQRYASGAKNANPSSCLSISGGRSAGAFAASLPGRLAAVLTQDFLNPNRSLESKAISFCCRADCPPPLSRRSGLRRDKAADKMPTAGRKGLENRRKTTKPQVGGLMTDLGLSPGPGCRAFLHPGSSGRVVVCRAWWLGMPCWKDMYSCARPRLCSPGGAPLPVGGVSYARLRADLSAPGGFPQLWRGLRAASRACL